MQVIVTGLQHMDAVLPGVEPAVSWYTTVFQFLNIVKWGIF